ncbi:fimbrial protein [Shewanella algae]|uniref:fimbrial protein n=1 Tax=Shewanella algae TaxID=38313 RepID=UPI0013DE75DE|nr:fimbrial protein [Shewanella algae]
MKVKADVLEFTVTGSVFEGGCNIVMDDANMLSIAMGSINGKDFAEVGDETEPMPFAIRLEDCDAETVSAKVTFSQAGNNGGELMNTQCDGEACGFKVGLKDSNGNITLGEASVQAIGSGSNELKFSSYLKRTQEAIKPGEFSATGQFEIEYD